ncbi:outer membrane protein assembly factor BamB family protein [Salmonirosea aquatica]|uniref:outer membrane protein assembly factor BamB family protein n=1 Tax=Salmonirosea aquatica TaxID=2654236 RepID=UPI003571267E
MKNALILFILVILLASLYYFTHRKPYKKWSSTLPGIGTFSSARVEDLNGDGVRDILLGAGKNEFEYSDSALVALDGKTGELLWHNSARDQMFGSAGLYDINGDGVKDAFFAGRSVEFKALDGKTGKTLWHFDSTYYSQNGRRWFNFYNPQFIHDVDADGLRDILISNGGDIMVPPFNPNRAAGRLVILSSATGKLLAEAMMPDNKEIYMSIAVDFNEKEPEQSRIIFGTGGESIAGNLFVGTIRMVLDGDLTHATKIASGENRGFIAPPAWVDMTQDGVLDIVVNSVDGRVMGFDGKNLALLWSTAIPKTEAYASMAIGNFNEDTVPDFFISFAKGRYPRLTWTKQAMLDGKTGAIQFLDSLGYYQTSSPIAVDLNGDGRHEVLLSVENEVVQGREQVFYTNIVSIDFSSGKIIKFVPALLGHNLSSTPWVGDLDNDGYLDLIYTHSTDKYGKLSQSFQGMQVHRFATTIPIKKAVQWGAYMGSAYDGVYRTEALLP